MASGEGYPMGCAQHGVQTCWTCWNQQHSSFMITPAMPMTVIQQGWQCPVCSHVMAPFMSVCPYCPRLQEGTVSSGSATITYSAGMLPCGCFPNACIHAPGAEGPSS